MLSQQKFSATHISRYFDQLTPCESFGLVNILSKQWSMLDIFIAALNTETMQYKLSFVFKGLVHVPVKSKRALKVSNLSGINY